MKLVGWGYKIISVWSESGGVDFFLISMKNILRDGIVVLKICDRMNNINILDQNYLRLILSIDRNKNRSIKHFLTRILTK